MEHTLDWPRLGRLGLALLGGALMGYVAGFILGWALLDPDTDLWALLAGVGAIVGALYGLRRTFWEQAGAGLSAVGGLYLGWVLRTLIFGDVSGGAGLILIVVLGLAGSWLGRRWRITPVMFFAILFGGFFGGFLLGEVLGLRFEAEIVGYAPAVFISAVLSGGLVWYWQQRRLK